MRNDRIGYSRTHINLMRVTISKKRKSFHHDVYKTAIPKFHKETINVSEWCKEKLACSVKFQKLKPLFGDP